MKKITKYILGIVLSILFLFADISTVNAASASISVSSSASTVVLGNTFTVTIKISSSTTLGAWDFTPSYDSGKFKLVSGDTSVADYGPANSKSYTYKFKAVGTGSGTISVKSYGAYDYDNESKMSISVSSKTIKVLTQAERKAQLSNNNKLKDLYVEGFELEPSFSKDVTEYRVEAGDNTTKINIVGVTDDPAADHSNTGEHEVSEGENKFTITCTAQNGDTKSYTIIVNVSDPNPIEVKIGDETYTIVKREASLKVPNNYEKTTTKINDQDVPALFNELNGYTLVGLKDKDNNVGLYVYDNEALTYEKYEEVQLSQMLVFPLAIDKKFDSEYKKTEIDINETKFEALKINKNGLYIIHARDLLTGKDNYYKYDSETNTMIRYLDEAASYKKSIKEYEKLLMILGAETVIIIFVLICILISKMRKNKRRKKKIEEMKEKALLEEREKALQLEKEKEEVVENNNEIITSETNKKKKKTNSKKKKEVLKDEEKKDNKGDN